jgi:hypothetical protein
VLPRLSETLRARPEATVVDVGTGDAAPTVRELVLALRERGLANPVLAIDAEAARVERAQAELVDLPGLTLRQADLRDLPALVQGAGLVRVANVLRQCEPTEIPQLHGILTRILGPGGRVLEGSCDLAGTVSCMHLLGPESDRQSILFATTLAGGFAPLRFRDHLPRDLRRRVRQTPALEALFARWTAAFHAARADGCHAPAALFVRSVEATEGLELLATGPVHFGACWQPAGGVPVPTPES